MFQPLKESLRHTAMGLDRFRQARNREQSGWTPIAYSAANLIPVHWLHTHAYCEYQLYLEKALGVEAPPTADMLAGSEKHSILDREHQKEAKVELTVSEAASKAQLEAISLVSRDITVKGLT